MKIQVVGKLLIAAGLLMIVYALNMPVSHGYSDTVNYYLISQRQNTLILGGFLFISGIVFFAAFKIKQTKEEEADSEASEAIKQKAVETIASGRRVARMFFDRVADVRGEHVDSLQDCPVARALTGLYVGFLLSIILGDFFEYGIFIGLPISLWLSFRPRAASLVISRVNMANIALIIVFWYHSIRFKVHLLDLLVLLTIITPSVVLWIYASKRIKPRS